MGVGGSICSRLKIALGADAPSYPRFFINKKRAAASAEAFKFSLFLTNF